MSKTYWKTRSGEMIDIDKMSITHLRNALKMVVKHYGQPKEEEEDNTVPCNACDGTGQVLWGISDAWGTDGGYDECEFCAGKGTLVKYGNTKN